LKTRFPADLLAGTKETQLNTTTPMKVKRKPKLKPTCKFKNCSHMRVHHCAQLSYTTQHATVLIIFTLNLQMNIIALMPSNGEEKKLRSK